MNQQEHPLPPCPDSPNCARVAVEFEASGEQVLAAFDSAITEMGAHSKKHAGSDSRIDAVFRIPVFGWKDDVAVLADQQKNSTITYIRSASRVGYWDLGVNKRRIRRLIRLAQKQLSL